MFPNPLWRGSLLPLGCAAAPKSHTAHPLNACGERVGAASLPSGSKLPRHKSLCIGFASVKIIV
ncbi:hypothetical protein E1K68_10895 [Pseudomonas sp. B2021]|nr:hypothetical protein [Pseudomonas sp. B2021]